MRHRTGKGAVPSYGGVDAWQLELLCNVAASEILVPDLMLPELSLESLEIHELMRLRAKFDVSTEAMLRRAVAVTGRSYALASVSPLPVGSGSTLLRPRGAGIVR